MVYPRKNRLSQMLLPGPRNYPQHHDAMSSHLRPIGAFGATSDMPLLTCAAVGNWIRVATANGNRAISCALRRRPEVAVSRNIAAPNCAILVSIQNGLSSSSVIQLKPLLNVKSSATLRHTRMPCQLILDEIETQSGLVGQFEESVTYWQWSIKDCVPPRDIDDHELL